MTRRLRIALAVLSLALAAPAFFSGSTVLADDHPGKGKGKGRAQSHEMGRSGGHGGSGPSLTVSIDFRDQDRSTIRAYYGEVARSGRCPPGLAKKNNGCLPPGQAKKWQIGRPLPRDVIFHDLPRDLSVRIALPPEGYRYVRVASDILMIAVGTGMVAAAIEDLARL